MMGKHIFKKKMQKREIKYFAKGKHSFVFLAEIKTKNKKTKKIKNIKVIIKKSRSNTKFNIQHEAEILKIVNKYKIGPKLINYKNHKNNTCFWDAENNFVFQHNQITEEFIKGKTIENFLKTETNQTKIKKIIKQILNQCKTLDKLKLNKEEMSNPYKHIIIQKIKNKTILKPVMIDFERAHFTESPSNTTQFFQYLMKYKLITLNEQTKQLLINYKKSQSKKDFEELIKII